MNVPARHLTLPLAVLVAVGAGLAAIRTGKVLADDPPKTANVETGESVSKADNDDQPYVPKSKRELQRTLTRLQFDVTQNEATEPAFRNKYWNNKKDGIYKCVVCGQRLFSSQTKYESGTGWPSFYAPIGAKQVGTRTDYRLFFARTEVHCSRCKAHLGHVFDDGPKPTGLRYCMNSASLQFEEASKADGDRADGDSEDQADGGKDETESETDR